VCAAAFLAACTAAGPENAPASTARAEVTTPPATPDASATSFPDQNSDGSVGRSTPISRVVLESGLILEDLALGNGLLCSGPDSTITVLYTGTLPNGTVFDATPPNQPASLPLAQLIEGWKDGIPGMRVGGKRRLTVPADMAYGRRGLSHGDRTVIPPHTPLVFVIELLGVR
jgi:FKBP-type peptidyl-prolyl cis-trans isomerase